MTVEIHQAKYAMRKKVSSTLCMKKIADEEGLFFYRLISA